MFKPENVKDAVEIAGQRKSVLDRLGKSRELLETVLEVGEALGDVSSEFLPG